MLYRNLGSTALNGLNNTRNLGLFSRLGNSLNAIKAINWTGFINNTSKTLGIINQTIPLVKQVGPMMNNMKSILKIASIFKDETDKIPKNSHLNVKRNNKTSTKTPTTNHQPQTEDYSPTFFIEQQY